jgi:hypothetical protein
MGTPEITVIIPTVTGRERYLAQCIESYKDNTQATVEFQVFKDLPGVAFGWQRGAEAANGRWLHMTNDDAEAVRGWDVPAIEMASRGIQPCPRLWNPDGTPWANAPADRDPWSLPHGAPAPLSTIPFLDRNWWPDVTPLPPGMHYFSDNWISWRLEIVGIPTAICHGYDFVHHWAAEHRGAGWTEPQRMQIDETYANMALQIVQGGALALQQQPGWNLVNE